MVYPALLPLMAHTSAASSRLNWRPTGRLKWTRPFRRKTKSGFCACAITFQLASNDGFIPGVKWPRHTADQPQQHSTQVSYKYSYTCTRHCICMTSYEATFTFTLKHKIVIKLPGLCQRSLKQILCTKSYVCKLRLHLQKWRHRNFLIFFLAKDFLEL